MKIYGHEFNTTQTFIAVIGIAVVAALGLGVVAGLSSNRQIFLATTRQPETFTELYLNTPGYLPKDAVAGEPASFSYNITNHENSTVTYNPVVTIIENGVARTLEKDEIVLKNDDSRNTTVKFTVANPGVSYEVVVALPVQGQSVHFRGRS